MKAGDKDYSAIYTHWDNNFPGSLTEILAERIEELVEETSPEAVIHGIDEAVAANARNFRYVAECARNHIQGEDTYGPDTRNLKLGDPLLNPDPAGRYRLVEAWEAAAGPGIINT